MITVTLPEWFAWMLLVLLLLDCVSNVALLVLKIKIQQLEKAKP